MRSRGALALSHHYSASYCKKAMRYYNSMRSSDRAAEALSLVDDKYSSNLRVESMMPINFDRGV